VRLSSSRGRVALIAPAIMALCTLLTAGCAASSSPDLLTTFATSAPTDVPATPSTVPVTLYFRSDATGESMLVPVEREIPRGDEPARRALEMLIEGPQEDEGLPVVPADTVIEEFAVVDDTARVVLRGALDEGATAEAAQGPRGSLLTLAAIADTLTEFPSITTVALEAVDLDEHTAFDGWGIPDALVRDETFIEPAGTNDPFPALATFSINPQEVGSPAAAVVDDGAHGADGVPVAGVRVIDRLTYVRVVIEFAEQGGDLEALPWARARALGQEIAVTVRGAAVDGPPVQHDGPGGPVAEVSLTPEDGGALTLSVSGAPIEPQPFHLMTEHSPSRLLLDVKK
jgi:hypothetical protein